MTQSVPQTPARAAESAMSITGPGDIWRIIRKRLFLIIACFVVFGLGGTGALIGWAAVWPYYHVEGLIEVEPGQARGPEIVRGYTDDAVPFQLYDQYMLTQSYAIKGSRVIDAALKQLGPEQNMYAGPTATYDLQEDLAVVYMPGSQLISVGLSGRNPKEIMKIVRAVLDEYMLTIQSRRRDLDSQRQSDLRTEQDDLRRQLDNIGRQLAAFRDESGVVILDERANEELARLTTRARQLEEVDLQLQEARHAWNQFQELQQQVSETNDPTPMLTAFPDVMDGMMRDPTIGAMSRQAAALAQNRDALKQRFGLKHDAVRRAEKELEGARTELQQEQAEQMGQLIQQQGAVLRTEFERLRESRAQLELKVNEARAAAIDISKRAAEYRARETEYRRLQDLLDTVTEGLERMRIASALSRPNISIARRPDEPLERSQPRLILYVPAALIVGLLIGLSLSLVLEFMDTKLRTPTEVVRQLGVPLLGTVPDLSEDEHLALDANVAMVSYTSPHSLIAEAFRQFRTNLLFASDVPVKSLLVTSPGSGDGKSTTAANLAIAQARAGAKVLLVEANYRRPSLSRLFDVPDAVGLSNILVGLTDPSEAIQASAVENLDLLVGGAVPPSPADLLGSESMRDFIVEQTRRYDHVIIDGAPALVVSDNHLLAEAVDGVVMVFRANENTRGLANRAIRQLMGLRVRLLGAVLNRVLATKGGYFREVYEAYYDYARAAPSAAARAGARPPARAQAGGDALAAAAATATAVEEPVFRPGAETTDEGAAGPEIDLDDLDLPQMPEAGAEGGPEIDLDDLDLPGDAGDERPDNA